MASARASAWRISEQNPIRDLESLDYERWAALHNKIVERGWLGAGHALDDLDRTTYFESCQNYPSWHPEYLHSSVVEFFKRAITPATSYVSFFYTVHGLRGTDILFAHCNYGIDPDPHRFVNLYGTAAVMQSSHPVGIVFDQHTFHAIFQPAMMDSETTMMGGRLGWLPLEMILDSFLDLLDQGKVVALPQDPALMSPTGPWKPFQAPWTMVPFSDHDLQSALFHFERLVDAIERRMPPGSVPDVPVRYGLLDAGVEEEGLSGSRRMLEGQDFARRFLAGARRPRFRHIAPGLTCVGSGPQPFASLAPVDDIHTTFRPVLLARGEADAAPDFQVRKRFQEADPPIPCGLYLSETDLYCAQPFEVCRSHMF